MSQPSSVQIRLVRRFRNEDDILPFVDYFKDTDRNKVNGLQGIPCLIYLYWLFFCTVIIVVAAVVVIFAVSISVVVVFFGYRYCHCCCFCNCFCCCCCCCCCCRCSWCHSTVVVLGVCSTLIKSLLVVGGVSGAYNLWIRSYSNINCTGKIIRIFLNPIP